MKKIIFVVFVFAFLANFISASGICGDTDGNGILNFEDLQNIQNYAFEYTTVPEGVMADLNGDGVIDLVDVSIMINHVNRGADAPTCGVMANGEEESSCEFVLSPDSLYDDQTENIYHDGEDRLQKILDDAGYNIDVDDDQSNIQMWTTLDDVELEVTYLKTISSYRHEFGYYIGREAEDMNKIFTDDETETEHASVGDKFNVDISEGNVIGFYSKSIRDDGGEYFTENALNIDEKDRVVVYDLGDEFIIAIEDWVDYDYQDLVVSVKVICDDDDEEEEDTNKTRQNHGSDQKWRVIDLGAGYCEPNWQCSGWSECVGETMTRTCIDTNFCDYEFNKPYERTSCTIEKVYEEVKKPNTYFGLWLVLAILLIALLTIAINWNEFG